MAVETASSIVHPAGVTPGLPGVVTDFGSDKQAFVVPWGKAMMWIFLLSDTFIFTCFLTAYMHVRMSSTVPWPNPSEVFALTIFGQHIPLILIAIMTFVLISSSGTMAMAVNYGYRRNRAQDHFAYAAHGGVRRHLRRHAGLRVDEADRRRRRAALEQPDGRRAVRRGLLHDHRLPRPARDRPA